MKDFASVQRLEDREPSSAPEQGEGAGLVVQFTHAQPDLELLMETYGSALLRLCFIYLKDMQLAEDAVQETFIKVYKNYHRFDGGDGEKSWVTRIAVNVCKDMLRNAWRRRVSVVEELNAVPDSEDPYAAADTATIEAVMALKPKYREVVLLFYYQDMKIADISRVLDTPESTVAVRLKRARDALKKTLGGWYYAEG